MPDFDVPSTAGQSVHDAASADPTAHLSDSPVSEWEQQLHGDHHEGAEAIPLQKLPQLPFGRLTNEPNTGGLLSDHEASTTDASHPGSPLQAIARGESSVHLETGSPTAHPLSAHLPTGSDDPAEARLEWIVGNEEHAPPETASQFNGFKFRDPDIAQGAANFLAIPGVRSDPHRSITDDPADPPELNQVSFRVPGYAHLQPGRVTAGGPQEVENQAEMRHPLARTDGHSHPAQDGAYENFRPSTDDQLVARSNQNVRSFVKVPDYHKAPNHEIVQYSGAMPLRHYVSLPNDGSHPLKPDSPDNYSPGGTSFVMPPFRHAPLDYPAVTRHPGPTDENSLSGSEAEAVSPMESDDESMHDLPEA